MFMFPGQFIKPGPIRYTSDNDFVIIFSIPITPIKQPEYSNKQYYILTR